MEWPDYYEKRNLDDLLRFFDYYLKGVDNGWIDTPRVRYAVLDLTGGDRINDTAKEFPPPSVTLDRFYLDATRGALPTAPPSEEAQTAYDARSLDGHAAFTLGFASETELVGYPKVHLFVEVDGADDMDLFVLLQKLDAAGKVLEQFNVPNQGPEMEALTRKGAAILKYKGSNGRLRVAMRHLDAAESTEAIPVHSFDRLEKLSPGEIVSIDIDLFPIGLVVRPEERLRLILSGEHLLGGVMPGTDNIPNANTGRHIIHTGGRYASFLQLPVLRGTGA